MKDKPVINIVVSQCQPSVDDKLNKWYDEVHIPMLRKFKGLKVAKRYKILKATGENPEYLATYEFENKKDFEAYEKSPEFAAAQAERMETWKDGGWEAKFRAQYELIREWKR